jgi:outer membrane protein insertion porin family
MFLSRANGGGNPISPPVAQNRLPMPVRRLAAVAALVIAALSSACTPPGATATGPFPRFSEFDGWRVTSVRFTGELPVPPDSLRRVIVTRGPTCVIPLLPARLCPGFARRDYHFNRDELARDLARLQLYHRDFGYYGTRIAPFAEPVREGRVAVRFAVAPGDLVLLRELGVEGTEEIVDPQRVLQVMPLEVGEPFRRRDFVRSADTLRSMLVRRGYAYSQVLRNFDIDTVGNVAEAHFVAIPGPLVLIDTIRVEGAERLGERTVRRMLTFREEDVLQTAELNRSQRNLYRLGFVNFASVQVSADTIQVHADTARAAVVVRVVEAARYGMEAAGGYGTLDCLRTGGRAVDRNFLGGARRLELNASLSKIGVGEPLGFGLERSICRVLADDPFSQQINYRGALDFEQPQLFGTANRLLANLHTERFSQLNAYLRQSTGGQLAVTRDLGVDARATITLNAARGFTQADPVYFCAAFNVCTVEDQEVMVRPRWTNSLALSGLLDRTEQTGARLQGYTVRGSVDWASQVLLSDDRYLGLQGQVTGYRPVREGWVLAGRLQGGYFIDPAQGYIPPNRRFYAGGPMSVRGFEWNELGPTAYVARDVRLVERDPFRNARPRPIGGTRLVVASAELRTPSPWYPDLLRLGFFLDAGQVWDPEADIAPEPIRVTPGLGARITTPVGPLRLDVGYNPYRRRPGPLYSADTETGELRLLDENFTLPERGGFFGRLVFHPAVGQAF